MIPPDSVSSGVEVVPERGTLWLGSGGTGSPDPGSL